MFRNEIIKGIDFLMSVQNIDGGIPGMKSTGRSACWTTAEALEAVLLSPYLRMDYHAFIYKMVNFLLDTQISDPNNLERDGAWPEYATTPLAQTFTTGHALAALNLARKIIVDDDAMLQKINTAISRGFRYLNDIQNVDGGWALEPEGTGEEKESRAFATAFVLRGYIQNGYTVENNRAVRLGCEFLKSLRDTKSGGFSKLAGELPDVCYTGRIIAILLKAKAYLKKDPLIKKAIKFIFKDVSLKELFKIRHETYVSESSSGMVVFHSNTPIDVMEALCICNIYDRRVKRLEKWIIQTQEDSGGWYLGGTRDPQINEGVITWTTNEAIYALICADKTFSTERHLVMQKRLKKARKLLFTLVILMIILLFFPPIDRDTSYVVMIWNLIPSNVQNYLVVTVFGGLLLNLFSSSIYDWIKKLKGEGEEH